MYVSPGLCLTCNCLQKSLAAAWLGKIKHDIFRALCVAKHLHRLAHTKVNLAYAKIQNLLAYKYIAFREILLAVDKNNVSNK